MRGINAKNEINKQTNNSSSEASFEKWEYFGCDRLNAHWMKAEKQEKNRKQT